MKQVRKLIPALLLAVTAPAGAGAQSVPYPDALQAANVTLTNMSDGQESALMLGNGDLYGIVWDRDGQLFLRMTKNDIWDARVDTSKDEPLPTVDIAAGTVTGKRGAGPSWKLPYPQPRCAIALRLGLTPSPLRAQLNLRRAVVDIGKDGADAETQLRVLNDRNVLLVNSPHNLALEEIKAESLPPAKLGTEGEVSWLLMKLPGDMDYKGMDYAVALAARGNLKAISVVSSHDLPNGDVLKEAIALAKATVAEPEASLVKAHEAAWTEFWSRSGLQLGDEVMQRWWYRILYFAGTVCRPGTAPVALMPPLATDKTPWHADYHHNYNTWQCFYPLPGLNHPERVDPWISYVDRMIPRFKFLAKETYGIEGVHVPISSFLHEPDPADCRSKNQRQLSMQPWGLTIGLQAMTLQSMWQKYLYDQDAAYMAEHIYPYLREVARFYVNFIAKCERTEEGRIRLGPSYSPEHGSAGIYDCPFDIAYVCYTMNAMIEAGELLDRDADLVAACRELKAQLPGYPTSPDANGEPIIVDWEGCKVGQIKTHNITVPASPVFPADQVTWFSSEAEKELFRRTMNQVNFRDANAHVMFNIARARLSMPEAVPKAREWFASRELPNGFFEWAGHQHGTYMQEMVGIAGLINEFLLQSVDDKIRLFPCWPEEQDASFSGLRAQRGFLVSAEFKDGEVVSAVVESTAGGKLQLLSPWKTLYVNGRKAELDETGLFILETKPGEILTFTKSAGMKQPDEVRAQQIKDLKWGMFICWSFSTFSGREWTPTLDKDASYFKVTGCDTDQWCKTAKEAGMGYILFLTKHHDGFCLWDTKTTDKKVTNSPLGIDVLAKLRTSCDKYGLKLALYFSEGDWNWPNAVDGKGGINKRPGYGENTEVKKEQLKELLTQYGPIEFWWMDGAAGYGGLSHQETIEWMHRFQPNTFVGGNQGVVGGRINLRERGRPGPIGDEKAVVHKGHLSDDYSSFHVAEFTYPILPKHQGGANWFYSLPKHDNLVHPPEKLHEDYLGARKFENIFSINVGPNYEGKIREVDVKVLREVGRMIREAKDVK